MDRDEAASAREAAHLQRVVWVVSRIAGAAGGLSALVMLAGVVLDVPALVRIQPEWEAARPNVILGILALSVALLTVEPPGAAPRAAARTCLLYTSPSPRD